MRLSSDTGNSLSCVFVLPLSSDEPAGADVAHAVMESNVHADKTALINFFFINSPFLPSVMDITLAAIIIPAARP
jgi:hypothetical protein